MAWEEIKGRYPTLEEVFAHLPEAEKKKPVPGMAIVVLREDMQIDILSPPAPVGFKYETFMQICRDLISRPPDINAPLKPDTTH